MHLTSSSCMESHPSFNKLEFGCTHLTMKQKSKMKEAQVRDGVERDMYILLIKVHWSSSNWRCNEILTGEKSIYQRYKRILTDAV
jgi:hypothetical protein